VTAGSIEVTIAGQVRQVLANGDFVVNDGKVDYTVTMSATTTILDVNGAQASPDDVQLDGSAQVTGLLSGSTITAETVTVATPRADVPATT
jgi:flagellar basal body L-ring protein FlgH